MAYTKYSLTPANNNATPPDGAPEGMLPSAVNDTMRDMMAQIRDVGDGIRNGTYTMTAPVITGGSITGSTINNSAIGATTANSGAFTTLSASGVATISAGTVSAPALTTTGDTNTGIFFPAADTIAFTEGGVESMRIDSSGNVGIGNSNPSTFGGITSLSIGGSNRGLLTIRNASNADRGYVYFDGTNFNVESVGTALNLVSPSAQPIIFTNVSTERMRIDSSGNVGIGTSSFVGSERVNITFNSSGATTQALNTRDSNASANGNYHIVLRRSDDTYLGGLRRVGTDNAMGVDGNAYLSLQTTGTERMRIDSSGNVGIGMTPIGDTALEIYNANSATVYKNVNSGTDGSSGFYVGMGKGSLTEAYVYNRENNNIIFGTNNSERMRITSGGQLLVAKTTADDTTQGLRYTGGDSAPYLSVVRDGNPPLYLNRLSSDGRIQEFARSNTVVGNISVTTTATAYNTSSDYRLKENIAPMTGALNIVQQLKPVTYNWKVDGSSGQGFIAHELQAVVPDCVTGEKDAVDEEGKPVYQGVDTSFLVATLTAALQESHSLIKDLQARVDALESK